ncbi:hypothetical protein PV11_06395 [Exophiala sideris]|uniref:DUF6606 domain-containing protein n=1 Tax=Exophiala sideris TaxID=1016849 RepID=A0A0D1VRS5_9EURO|nr:hypothetical protein PV11_06395 [Exophiala sideris]
MDPKLLRGVFNHVVLPPNVPGSADKNLSEINCDLLGRIHTACTQLRENLGGHYDKELDLLLRSLVHCQSLHTSLHLDSAQLQRAFRSLKHGEVLIIHVVEQNAGLLISYGSNSLSGHVLFEAFEVSAKSENVLQSQNALQWDFPTSAASIPVDVFNDFEFQRNLAQFVDKASLELVKKFGAFTNKAKSRAYEPRDSTDPALITGMLISLLEGIGHPVAVTHPARKRVRDEVRWKDSYIPWRRSPFWLLARVGIIRHLERLTGTTISTALYKAMMCLVHAHLLEDTVGVLSLENSQLLLSKLCRRIAKVEKDALLATPGSDASAAYTIIIEKLRHFLFSLTKAASDRLQNTWESYKDRTKRQIPQFRTRVAGPTSTVLALKNSLPYLNQIQQHPLVKQVRKIIYVMPQPLFCFTKKYANLAEVERQMLAQHGSLSSVTDCSPFLIYQLSDAILGYLKQSEGCY